MDTRRAMASSGSMFGSTGKSPMPPPVPAPPNASPAPPGAAPIMPPPPMPSETMGDVMSTSAGTQPAGIVTRLLLPSWFTALTNSSSFSWLSSTWPMLTTSTAILFFLRALPALVRDLTSLSMGEPMKTTMRWAPFLFRRCLSAKAATWTPSARFRFLPNMLTSCSEFRILPMSSVGDTRTSGPLPARDMTPTVDSAFACILALETRLAASCMASSLLGT
mmetsp:Transcript_14152/g.41701  ORF Transcript_14152/g.41701 Transcript_14152/m.41701 type:complete len:220 (-) Transcript_14152:123-782(-)